MPSPWEKLWAEVNRGTTRRFKRAERRTTRSPTTQTRRSVIGIWRSAGAPDTPEIATEMRDKVTEARKRNKRIIWIEKMVTKREAIQLYSNARVFCCPSVYEPFGIINLEAMACHAPVVASATGGIKEVVVENETGYLIPFEQDTATGFATRPDKFARDLAARLRQLLADPARCKQFGKAGRKRVEETFSWRSIASQTVELYRFLIDKSKEPSRS